jgi:hypothetical protein
VRGVIGVLDTSLVDKHPPTRYGTVEAGLPHATALVTHSTLLVRTVIYRTVHADNRLSPHLAQNQNVLE